MQQEPCAPSQTVCSISTAHEGPETKFTARGINPSSPFAIAPPVPWFCDGGNKLRFRTTAIDVSGSRLGSASVSAPDSIIRVPVLAIAQNTPVCAQVFVLLRRTPLHLPAAMGPISTRRVAGIAKAARYRRSRPAPDAGAVLTNASISAANPATLRTPDCFPGLAQDRSHIRRIAVRTDWAAPGRNPAWADCGTAARKRRRHPIETS